MDKRYVFVLEYLHVSNDVSLRTISEANVNQMYISKLVIDIISKLKLDTQKSFSSTNEIFAAMTNVKKTGQIELYI